MASSIFKALTTNYNFDVKFLVLTVVSALVAVVFVKIIGLFRHRWFIEKAFSKFPCYDRHWLLGHLNLEGDRTLIPKMLTDHAIRAKYAYQLWQGPFIGSLVVVHPDMVKTILTTSEPKDELVYSFIRPWIGDGLLLSKGKKWARNRRLLTPAFHFEVLRPYTSIFRQSTKTLVNKWNRKCNGKEISLEMFSEVSLLTLDGLLKCIFTVESDCQNKEILLLDVVFSQGRGCSSECVQDISEAVGAHAFYLPFMFNPIFELSPTGRVHRRAVKQAHDFTQGVIKSRREAIVQHTEERSKYLDFLDILLQARDADGTGLSDQEIQDEVDTFMFEGHDTTASGLSWMMVNMALHPEYQSKCREEIDALMESKPDDNIEWDDLSKLPYLTMCVKESMRLRPPVPGIRRVTTRELTFPDGRTVPAGSAIGIGINALHHNPHVWKDPETYDPERFSPENIKNIVPFSYVPFSAGPRNCIGQNFALNETKMVSAVILRHFYLSMDQDKAPPRLFQLVLRSPEGINVNVRPRKL
ncbi:LOW QUALITY PROTEIN: leukotriene-B4 omega-hydroxylase 3-like [Amphiura filiformis]|uniref:LOW QUALITY PROTEIN: leukotriene-B4 omega-hydroxylase 3-like n=1 Tax=Amphiura filiformis TaxID=82378 RepID=UPI003B21750F